MALGILLGLAVTIAGLVFAVGLILDQAWLIGLGLLGMALCAIFGLQPDWPRKRRES